MDTFKEYQTIATSIPISLRNNRDRILLPVTALQQEAGKIGAVFAGALDARTEPRTQGANGGRLVVHRLAQC